MTGGSQPMSQWNFADVWEVVADRLPDAPMLVHGERRQTWAEVDRRADGVARTLLESGATKQDKVAHYLHNCPEYLESLFGIWKSGLVPVNTNYRYADDELVYLWDNADAIAVVFHATFSARIEGLRSRVPQVRLWLWVDDGSGPCPDWAVPYEDAAKATSDRTMPSWGRSADDLYLLYTGGTTGMPKGVMWRQDDLFGTLNATNLALRYPEDQGLDGVRASLKGPGLAAIPACPLMHGTGAFTAFSVLNAGGCVATLTNRRFDVVEMLETIERERVAVVAIVGDAFGKPMLRALDDAPGRYDISSLMAVVSSGVMWSEQTKQGLLKHHPGMLLVDAFSSSEALGMGTSISSAGGTSSTAKFALGENARVITEDGRDVEPGSGDIGLVAVKGRTPVGYYKDEEKSARTFKVIDGERYSIPGDWAMVEADGSLKLLGRGSQCINTGGEKVYPEEVEEVLKLHPSIRDAAVVGLPDERFGEVIVALVEAAPDANLAEDEVINHVKGLLASYKSPRRVLPVDSVGRAPNGKLDYKRLRDEALERVSAS
ncbi:MAG TPA: acyl-CoA synthetase [Acidimicrobiales bacterium]|nr:acyl-CoA synthetase [Acidimicrobiales bacterium]